MTLEEYQKIDLNISQLTSEMRDIYDTLERLMGVYDSSNRTPDVHKFKRNAPKIILATVNTKWDDFAIRKEFNYLDATFVAYMIKVYYLHYEQIRDVLKNDYNIESNDLSESKLEFIRAIMAEEENKYKCYEMPLPTSAVKQEKQEKKKRFNWFRKD